MRERHTRVLVAGATGRLGREMVKELKRRGVRVRAMGRDMARLRTLCPEADEHVAADALDPEQIPPALCGVDMVASCMGASVVPSFRRGRRSFGEVDVPANLNLIAAARSAGVRRMLYVSVFTGGKLHPNGLTASHERVEAALKSSGLESIVVRPTGFISSLVDVMRVPVPPIVPEVGNGQARMNPIHEADLAAFCAEKLLEDGGGEYDVGGPEVLTRREIANLVWGSAAGSRPVLRVPVGALRGASLLCRPVNPRVSELLDFIAGVLSTDLVAPAYGSITLAAYLRERGQRRGCDPWTVTDGSQ